jgi:hypothetical protein
MHDVKRLLSLNSDYDYDYDYDYNQRHMSGELGFKQEHPQQLHSRYMARKSKSPQSHR